MEVPKAVRLEPGLLRLRRLRSRFETCKIHRRQSGEPVEVSGQETPALRSGRGRSPPIFVPLPRKGRFSKPPTPEVKGCASSTPQRWYLGIDLAYITELWFWRLAGLVEGASEFADVNCRRSFLRLRRITTASKCTSPTHNHVASSTAQPETSKVDLREL